MLDERYSEQRVNLYYDLFVPDNDASGPRPLVVAFHGYEGNKESMMGLAQKINSDDFIIASVQGPNSFFVRSENEPTKPKIGFGWMMQYKADETIRLHHRTLLSVIEQIAADHAVDRQAIFLLAFSIFIRTFSFSFVAPDEQCDII